MLGITAYSPAIGTYGVPINSDIVLTFSEAIVRGTGNIIFTPLGEASQSYDVTDTARVTIVGDVSPNYLCLSLGSDMQKCKGKPVDITIAAGVFTRVDTTGLAAGDYDLKDQLLLGISPLANDTARGDYNFEARSVRRAVLRRLKSTVLVLFIVALLRENYLSGCSRFFVVQFHQPHLYHARAEAYVLGNSRTDPPSLAPGRPSIVTTVPAEIPVEPTLAPAPAPEKPQFKAVKRLAFARFPKTGSRYAIQKLRAVLGKDHLGDVGMDAFVIGSVRNPCEGYLSLWAFQSDPDRHAGLMKDLQERKPQDYAQLVGVSVNPVVNCLNRKNPLTHSDRGTHVLGKIIPS
eukprot:symbB.v1.2.004627.t2/scaffold262.1/size347640/2